MRCVLVHQYYYVVYHKLSTGSGNNAYIHYIETERFPVSLDKVFVIDILVWKFACSVIGHIHWGKRSQNNCLYVLYSLHIMGYVVVLSMFVSHQYTEQCYSFTEFFWNYRCTSTRFISRHLVKGFLPVLYVFKWKLPVVAANVCACNAFAFVFMQA